MGRIPVEKIASEIRLGKKYWIAFTGDSLASCEWVHPNWREIVIYALQNELTDYLDDWRAAEWSIKGFNFAYDGSTTRDVLDRVDDLLLVKPQLVISLMGANDRLYGIGVESSVNNISAIIKKLTDSGSCVVWCTSTPEGGEGKRNEDYKPYAGAVMRMTESDSFFKVDMFNKFKEFPLERFFTFKSEEIPIQNVKEGDPDMEHPNQLGNAYIAKVILKEAFGIEFDPEKYIRETLEGLKYPGY